MRLTNGQFVEQLLSSGISSNELVHYLEVSMKLLKKHGRSILTSKYLDEVKKASPETSAILASLKVADKTKISKIKTIIRLFKEKAEEYNKEFTIKSGTKDHYSLVKKFLDTKFTNSKVDQQENNGDEIKISGEGRFYKRSLEQDVKRILGVN